MKEIQDFFVNLKSFQRLFNTISCILTELVIQNILTIRQEFLNFYKKEKILFTLLRFSIIISLSYREDEEIGSNTKKYYYYVQFERRFLL